MYADFSLQRVTEDQVEQIVITEVKCFSNPQNDLQEFYTAIGQYLFYRNALRIMESAFPLYLAMPADAYARLSLDRTVLATLKDAAIKLIIVDVALEEVVQWLT